MFSSYSCFVTSHVYPYSNALSNYDNRKLETGWKKSQLFLVYMSKETSISRSGTSRERREAEMTQSLLFLSLVYMMNSILFPVLLLMLIFVLDQNIVAARAEVNVFKQLMVKTSSLLSRGIFC